MDEVKVESGWTPVPAASGAGPAAGAAGAEEKLQACRHCRQPILHSGLRNGKGEEFCCQGCLQVHDILGGNQWDRYYDLLEQGGRKAPKAVVGEEYAAFLSGLDDPRTLAGIGKWEDGRHSVSLESRDVVCAACGWLIENLLRDMPGVEAFDVDFLHGEIFLAYRGGAVSLKDILSAIARFGYHFRPKAADAPSRPKPDRALLMRLAVSGACFANSMAFAAANYVGALDDLSAAWMRLFGWLGFAMSLPAVTWGAQPFYAGALRALRSRRFNIDVTITLGILISLAVSAASVLAGDGAGLNYSDSLSGLVFFLLLGRWAVQRFEAGLALQGRWFDALRKGKARVLEGGQSRLADVSEVKAGETVEVGPREYLPFDGVLESPQAWLDNGLLTGESRPIHARAGEPVFAGSLNLKDPIAVLVTGSSGLTRIDRLGRELEELASGRRPLPDKVAGMARWFTVAVIAAGAAAFLYHAGPGGKGMLAAATIAASVFIISCSCALALAGPICRGLGLKRAQALGFHFKSQATLEALRDVRCVLFDKTGTLTFTHRTVSGWTWLRPWEGDADAQLKILRALRRLAKHSLHPVSVSLARALDGLEGSGEGPSLSGVREIPHFGITGRVPDGLPFRQITLCRYGAWEEADGAFAGLGCRVPSFSGTAADSCLFLDGEAAALIRFTDEIKPDVPALVRGLEARGIAVALLSGDNAAQVEAFAEACGIRERHGGLAPEEKREWARRYQKRYGACLAVGDGFNDSLLFGAADFAMAVQGGAVDLSSATDILSTGDRPSALGRLLGLSAGVRRGIAACYWVSGAYNAGAVAAAMAGLVTPLFAAVLMPVSSLSLCLAAWLAIPRD
jgi:cation transport ATPase